MIRKNMILLYAILVKKKSGIFTKKHFLFLANYPKVCTFDGTPVCKFDSRYPKAPS